MVRGPGCLNELGIELPNNSLKPITNTACVRTRLCKLQKGYTRLAAASDEAYQLLAKVGGSLRVLRLFPPLKLVAMISLKYC